MGDQGLGISRNPLQPEARVPECEGIEVRMVKKKKKITILPRVLRSYGL